MDERFQSQTTDYIGTNNNNNMQYCINTAFTYLFFQSGVVCCAVVCFKCIFVSPLKTSTTQLSNETRTTQLVSVSKNATPMFSGSLQTMVESDLR